MISFEVSRGHPREAKVFFPPGRVGRCCVFPREPLGLHLGSTRELYIYIYILDARERAKVRSLLDPSDQCDAKAFSPPISELGFSISLSEPQLSDLSASANLRLSLPPLKSISHGLRWYCC